MKNTKQNTKNCKEELSIAEQNKIIESIAVKYAKRYSSRPYYLLDSKEEAYNELWVMMNSAPMNKYSFRSKIYFMLKNLSRKLYCTRCAINMPYYNKGYNRYPMTSIETKNGSILSEYHSEHYRIKKWLSHSTEEKLPNITAMQNEEIAILKDYFNKEEYYILFMHIGHSVSFKDIGRVLKTSSQNIQQRFTRLFHEAKMVLYRKCNMYGYLK